MSANEIAMVSQQFRRRLEAILTADELACYDAYHQRLQDTLARHDPTSIDVTRDEQAVLEAIARDTQAAALRAQLDILLRISTSPQ
ncbi:MAG TPA: hypothetical protein VKE41_18355 [Roseiflexaceae bacterium]|nr:hypothetical protein [Roseiflexaceae bacterium]